MVKKRKELPRWVRNIVDCLEKDITKEAFIQELIRQGKAMTDEEQKKHLRVQYKELVDEPAFWERGVKRWIIRKHGWWIFAQSERRDIPPVYTKSAARCFKCGGPLYDEVHYRCEVCRWLVCHYDNACRCKADGYHWLYR